MQQAATTACDLAKAHAQDRKESHQSQKRKMQDACRAHVYDATSKGHERLQSWRDMETGCFFWRKWQKKGEE